MGGISEKMEHEKEKEHGIFWAKMLLQDSKRVECQSHTLMEKIR